MCDLRGMIETVNSGILKLKPLILSYIRNENIDWEDRWDLYASTPKEFFDISQYYENLYIAGKEIVWFDDHYIDRGALVDNVNIIRRYEDGSATIYLQKDIDNLKKDMLKSGIRMWINDW